MHDLNEFFDDDDLDEDDLPRRAPAEPSPEIPPPPAGPAETQEEVVARFQREFLATVLLESSKMEKHLTVETLVAAREKFFKDAGDPKDPVERVLLDQIFMMQFRSAVSLLFAAVLSQKDHAGMMAVCIRLNAEVRKTALALKALRDEPSRTRTHAAIGAKRKSTPAAVGGDNFAETDTKAFKAVPERGRKTQPRQAPRPVGRRASKTA